MPDVASLIEVLSTPQSGPPWRGKGPAVRWAIGVMAHLYYRGDMLKGWERYAALSHMEQEQWQRAGRQMMRGQYGWPDEWHHEQA
jgi:hypothetical protein